MTENDRITRLEEGLARLQRHVTEQDRVMLGLTETVDRMKREAAALRAQIDASEPGTDEPPGEVPPHY